MHDAPLAERMAQVIQSGLDDESRFPVCPWCWPADHEDRATAGEERFHFVEECALMELLDAVNGFEPARVKMINTWHCEAEATGLQTEPCSAENRVHGPPCGELMSK
jgi:hypothetical protein